VTLFFTAIFLILGFTVQSAFGFGVALISLPLLTLVLPITQITPLLAMLSMTLSVAIVWNTWRSIDRDIMWRLLLTASLGVPLGISFLVFIDEGIVKMTLGSVIVFFGAQALLSIKPKKPMPAAAVWPFGFVIGVLGGAYNLLGGPLVMCLQWAKLEAKTFRATVHATSLLLNLIIIIAYGSGGLLSKATLVNFSAGIIPMVIGGLLGNVLVKKINEDQFHKIIYAVLVVMGAMLIISGYQATSSNP